MDNSGVLYELAVRLDNVTLNKLVLTSSWEHIKKFLRDEHFWYRRLEFTSGKNLPEGPAEWSHIYKLFVSGERLELLRYCLSNMHLVNVYQILYWSIDWTGGDDIPTGVNHFFISEVASEQANLEVLLYGIARGLKPRSHEILDAAAERGDLELLQYLLTVLEPSLASNERSIRLALDLEAIREDHVSIVHYLFTLPSFDRKKHLSEMLNRAANNNSMNVLQYFIEEYHPSEKLIEDAAYSAARSGNLLALQFLLKQLDNVSISLKTRLLSAAAYGLNTNIVSLFFEEVKPSLGDKRNMLNSAIFSGGLNAGRASGDRANELVKYLLLYMNPATGDTNQALKISGNNNNIVAFKLLLADKRINPQDSFYDVLKSTNERIRSTKFVSELRSKWDTFNKRYKPSLAEEKLSNIYIQDHRVSLDAGWSIMLVVWTLRAHIKKAVEGYTLATGQSEDHLYELLENDKTSYGSLLRVIILKRYSSEELIDWLSQNRWEEDTTPLRRLLVSILHPTLKSREESTLAEGLIGAHSPSKKSLSSDYVAATELLLLNYPSSDAIEGCILLGQGRTTERDILKSLKKSDLYNMLLRELILKRLDLEYYLGWILEQLKKNTTDIKTKRLLSSAARSVLDDVSVVHTSDLFSAYRGFILLAVSSDGRTIMELLSSEDRITQEGIDLAGMLLGAYLGKRKIEG